LKRVLSKDFGVTEVFDYDPQTDTTVISYEQDVEPQLELNKKLQTHTNAKDDIKGGWLHYAHIPDLLILKWKFEKGIDVYDPNHKAAVFRLVNDPDYAHLKTTSAWHRVKG
jgi:hypothetical protein